MSPALDGDAPVETADRSGAFPRLDDGQLAALEAIGERRRVQRGEVLFREGDAHYDFFVDPGGQGRDRRGLRQRPRAHDRRPRRSGASSAS